MFLEFKVDMVIKSSGTVEAICFLVRIHNEANNKLPNFLFLGIYIVIETKFLITNLGNKLKMKAKNTKHSYLSSVFFLFLFCDSFVKSLNGELEQGEEIKRSQFPDGFFFGTSTSSFQIEGAYREDGKGLSNWDVYTHTRGNGANGDVADDHYHRYLEDIELMHSLGANAYRFSISWTRILPRGRFGDVNPSGVLFYNKIINSLLIKGIEPFVTIHHNDLPQELEDRYGSWLSPMMQDDFVHFAETCFKSFGDRVKYWITINEPNILAVLAYKMGMLPPLHCSKPYTKCPVYDDSNTQHLTAMHNMLLAHAKAVKVYRHQFQPRQRGSIGIVAQAYMFEPMTDNDLDIEAARRAMAFDLAWVFDPLVFGDYPPEMRRYQGNKVPAFTAEQKEYLKGSIDFIGINQYTALYAKDCIHSICNLDRNGQILGFSYLSGQRDGRLIGEPTAIPGLFVVPRGMEEVIEYLKERYDNKLIFVLENGYGSELGENVEDILHDKKRVEFHKAYLASLSRAISNGANVGGYFVWSLIDNFEWLSGYDIGMGLYYVDRKTLDRTPKLSARWYKKFLTNDTIDDYKMVTNSRSFRDRNSKVLKPTPRDGINEI